MDTTSKPAAPAPQAAWEVREDGTVWPVEVVSPHAWFGTYRVRREDGTVVTTAKANVRNPDNIDVPFRWTITPRQEG